jgi:hypothetical protein
MNLSLFSVAVFELTGKRSPWRPSKLCGCTISYKFSISYDIWNFLIHSHFLSSVYLSLMIHYSRMWVFLTKNILLMSVQTVYHFCPILPFQRISGPGGFDTFNSFCWFFWVQISAWFFQFLKICDFCFGNYFQIQEPSSSLVCLKTGFNSYVHTPGFEMLL